LGMPGHARHDLIMVKAGDCSSPAGWYVPFGASCAPINRKLGAWSYKEDRRLLELAKHSRQAEEIADLMNRSPDAIRKMAIRLGVSLNKAKGK